jgi:hypothetical protein
VQAAKNDLDLGSPDTPREPMTGAIYAGRHRFDCSFNPSSVPSNRTGDTPPDQRLPGLLTCKDASIAVMDHPALFGCHQPIPVIAPYLPPSFGGPAQGLPIRLWAGASRPAITFA